jgi:hypothetical protein
MICFNSRPVYWILATGPDRRIVATGPKPTFVQQVAEVRKEPKVFGEAGPSF